ncbi:uncharacterized protein BKA55DRAFT_682950 [Fusarium redolens]|uniref:Uncharacterized protein n=1 Tax=Fusarium redolens TaxID=48865 RepID=A0A9P9R9D8_FUSRE|nr:uncharacterized protein BKA55DRAFT_682950 [Fusarium redolens]KAH7269875.1 hypothetical protein BKA55DRAFT_682950 [Fusarium redolens]
MNNFTSGAIPNTRVTMRPNLTAGLFLNGRSSTYGQVTDLPFNDMTSVETCGEVGKVEGVPQQSTSENSSHSQDEVSNDGHTSLNPAEPPRATTNYGGREEESLMDGDSQENQQNTSQKEGFEVQSGSVSSTETTQASDCETPEAMLKRLIETGIFDGTGIFKTTSHGTLEPSVEDHGCLGMNGTEQSSKTPTYQDKGVMADPSRQSTLGPNIQTTTNITQFGRKDDAKDAPAPTIVSHSQYQRELPVPIYSTSTQVQSPVLPTSVIENNAHKIPEESCVTQPQSTRSISATNSRRHPLSQISEGGDHYIRCLDQNDRPGFMFPNLIAQDFNVEHLYHRASTEQTESKLMDLFVHRGLQSRNNTIPLSESPGFQHLHQPPNGLIGNSGLDPAVFPTAYSETYSDDREIQHDKTQLIQPDYGEDGETIHEFIKRIEGEVSMKWDHSQQSIVSGCIDDIEECDEIEAFEMENNEHLLQCSDIERNATIQSSFHGIYSSSSQGPVSVNQAMAEDWGQLGYEQNQYWTGKYHDEHKVSDAEMVGFWRPNRC